MKYALVADDGQARVVVMECDNHNILKANAFVFSDEGERVKSTCKFHVCRREPSPNGENLITIETWEKGQKI